MRFVFFEKIFSIWTQLQLCCGFSFVNALRELSGPQREHETFCGEVLWRISEAARKLSEDAGRASKAARGILGGKQ